MKRIILTLIMGFSFFGLFAQTNKYKTVGVDEFEKFIAELATGDDDAPVGVVADTLAVLPLLFVNGIYLIKIQITVVESLIYFTVIGWTIFD